MMASLTARAETYWTPERIQKLSGKRKLLVNPKEDAPFLFTIGIMNKDASISHDGMRKFIQINHMLQLVLPAIGDLQSRYAEICIYDLACGNAYLGLLVAWYLKRKGQSGFQMNCLDHSERLVAQVEKQIQSLDLQTHCSAKVADLQQLHSELNTSPIRMHMVLALHACDQATDFALAIAHQSKADYFAVAPCCQAELSQKWRGQSDPSSQHPFAPWHQTPHLRRESGALITDTLRLLLMRGHGYEVTATEFVETQHSAKNRMLLGTRRGLFQTESQRQFTAMAEALDAGSLCLERILPSFIKEAPLQNP